MKTKKASDIMTKDVIVINEMDTISNAASILLREKISGLPVVDSENKVVGIISETDIIKKNKIIESPRYFSFLENIVVYEDLKKIEKDIKEIAAYKVGELMSKDIIKVNEEDNFDYIANLMIKKSINRVPVVDKENKIKGIICRYDIIKSIYE